MNMKRTASLLLAATMGLGSLSAFAQGHERRDHDGWQGQRHEQRRDQRAMGNRDRDFDRHDHDRREHYGARGPEWRRGGHLPPEYRNRQYVVGNWHAHRLAPPPRGYHWVQVGNDYVLAAIATGLIANLIINQ